MKKFEVLRFNRRDFLDPKSVIKTHLCVGFPMGFQMSVMCVMIILCRHLLVPLFVSQPTAEIVWYSDAYLLSVAPFYLLLGSLQIHRSSVQSMGNGKAPFMGCIIELIVRIGATTLLAARIGYIGICLATPLAWLGSGSLLVYVYRKIR